MCLCLCYSYIFGGQTVDWSGLSMVNDLWSRAITIDATTTEQQWHQLPNSGQSTTFPVSWGTKGVPSSSNWPLPRASVSTSAVAIDLSNGTYGTYYVCVDVCYVLLISLLNNIKCSSVLMCVIVCWYKL
jgi:hypothetical protein